MSPLPVEVPIRRMHPCDMALLYGRRGIGYSVEPEPEDPPPLVCALLSSTWGSSSRAASILRKPDGFTFWHCDECRSPCSPSGMRSHVLPARGKAQMEVVCVNVRFIRKAEAMS